MGDKNQMWNGTPSRGGRGLWGSHLDTQNPLVNLLDSSWAALGSQDRATAEQGDSRLQFLPAGRCVWGVLMGAQPNLRRLLLGIQGVSHLPFQ